MIERVVLLKLKAEYTTPDRLAEVIDESARVLNGLEQVVRARVGHSADEATAADWDVLLAIQFEDIEDVEPYRVHPDHRAYVDDFLKPRLEAIRAWNFVIEA